jgi:ribosome-associated protein
MKREEIEISTPFIKLDALLKFAGAAMTGGHAKDMILSGEVKVDSALCEMRGKKIYPGMTVELEDMVYEVKARVD